MSKCPCHSCRYMLKTSLEGAALNTSFRMEQETSYTRVPKCPSLRIPFHMQEEYGRRCTRCSLHGGIITRGRTPAYSNISCHNLTAHVCEEKQHAKQTFATCSRRTARNRRHRCCAKFRAGEGERPMLHLPSWEERSSWAIVRLDWDIVAPYPNCTATAALCPQVISGRCQNRAADSSWI